jgi:hypothetical protein
MNLINISSRSSELHYLLWTLRCANAKPFEDIETLPSGSLIDLMEGLGAAGTIAA